MRVVLCGYYGKGNTGDEALLATLLQMLPEQVTPVVLSGNAAQTRSKYGVEVCDRHSILSIWHTIASADGFIWGGGSLIQDITSFRSPFYYFALMALAQGMGKITIAWAQGIGPLRYSVTRRLARSLFRGCTAVSVRDRNSAQWLTDRNIPFILAPDPVYALESSALVDLERLPSPRIAVVLRPHPQLTGDLLALLAKALIEFQQSTNSYILLLPFQPQTDLAIAEIIHQQLPDVSEIMVFDRPQDYHSLFQQVQLAIAMRLHGLIMAAGAGCSCFAISYDPKVTQLMQALNLPGWELDTIPQTPTEISQTWIDTYSTNTRLTGTEIEAIVTQSLQHQDILHQALSPV